MNEQDSPSSKESRSQARQSPAGARGVSPEPGGIRSRVASAAADANNPVFKKALEILRQEQPGPSRLQPDEEQKPAATTSSTEAQSQIPKPKSQSQILNEPIPARMLNEFVYCPRLFYYEFVEGVFVESADTLRGAALHDRVDSGTGAMPARHESRVQSPKSKAEPGADESKIQNLKSQMT